MRDKLKKYSLLLLAAALVSVSFASCSKDKATDPEPGLAEAQKEAAVTTAETTSTTAETQKPKKTTAKVTEKPAAKTTKKKETTASSAAVSSVTEEGASTEPGSKAELESYFELESGFLKEDIADMLGQDKQTVLESIKYNEDYMVEKKSDEEGTESVHYVVVGEKRYSFMLEFKDGKLNEIKCNTSIKDFNTALSAAKSRGWQPDNSRKVQKGRRIYIVTDMNAVYSIYKIRDEDGSEFMMQSYVTRK